MAERAVEAKEKNKKAKKKSDRSVRLFPANKNGYHVMHFLNFLRLLLYPWNAFFYPYKLYGHKKVGKGACIYIGNHFTMWDFFHPTRTTKEGVHYVVKESLTNVAFLRGILIKVGAISAMRDGSDIRTLTDSMKCLKNGEKVVIFPEGTRNRGSGEEFLPFRGGFALMAIRTKSPIVPFVICNRPKVFHRTHVVFGEPMDFSEYYDRKLSKEDYDEAEQKVVQYMYRLRDEHRAQLKEKKAKKGKKCRS